MAKSILITLLLSYAFLGSMAQSTTISYNKVLADSLGADDYGMKSFFLVILKTGSTQIDDKEKKNELFRGHLDNINRLAKEHKLIVAGPLAKNALNYRGIFILDIKTEKEAIELLKSDPAISAGIFEYELLSWYGSAALPLYLPFHTQIEKVKP